MTPRGALGLTWLSALTALGQSGGIFIPLPPSDGPPAPNSQPGKDPGDKAALSSRGYPQRGRLLKALWSQQPGNHSSLEGGPSLRPALQVGPFVSQSSKGVPCGTQVDHLSVSHFPPCPHLMTTALSLPYDEGGVPLTWMVTPLCELLGSGNKERKAPRGRHS